MKKTVSNEEIVMEMARHIEEGAEVVFTPKGTSMLPFIRGGRDSVVLKKMDELNTGDIVLARTSTGNLVIHRITDISGDVLTLMGDGNIACTEKSRKEDVTASVIRILRGGKVIDCNSRSHRRQAKAWQWLLPVRRYILAIYRRIIR